MRKYIPRPLRFPVIIGPTAGGKSALAVQVALTLRTKHHLPAEIITADSIQVYRGLDIGSAKPTLAERRAVPHHLIDVADPTDRFSVDAWLDLAEAAVADLRARAVLPIVVGGTHLYIKALLDGLFEGPPPDPALRQSLLDLPVDARRAELERVDPAAAARIHPNDARRTIRALEVHRQTGRPISDWQAQWDAGAGRTDCFLVGLDWPIEAINRRINARVRQMMELGLLKETQALFDAWRFGPQAREALGYKQLISHLQGECSLDDAIEQIKMETRRFAKNQRTWLRRLSTTPGALWIDMSPVPPPTTAQCTQLIVDKILKPVAA